MVPSAVLGSIKFVGGREIDMLVSLRRRVYE